MPGAASVARMPTIASATRISIIEKPARASRLAPHDAAALVDEHRLALVEDEREALLVRTGVADRPRARPPCRVLSMKPYFLSFTITARPSENGNARSASGRITTLPVRSMYAGRPSSRTSARPFGERFGLLERRRDHHLAATCRRSRTSGSLYTEASPSSNSRAPSHSIGTATAPLASAKPCARPMQTRVMPSRVMPTKSTPAGVMSRPVRSIRRGRLLSSTLATPSTNGPALSYFAGIDELAGLVDVAELGHAPVVGQRDRREPARKRLACA